jgi:hypothetical protein
LSPEHEKRIYLIGRFDHELAGTASQARTLGAAVRIGDVTEDATRRDAAPPASCCSLAGPVTSTGRFSPLRLQQLGKCGGSELGLGAQRWGSVLTAGQAGSDGNASDLYGEGDRRDCLELFRGFLQSFRQIQR